MVQLNLPVGSTAVKKKFGSLSKAFIWSHVSMSRSANTESASAVIAPIDSRCEGVKVKS